MQIFYTYFASINVFIINKIYINKTKIYISRVEKIII